MARQKKATLLVKRPRRAPEVRPADPPLTPADEAPREGQVRAVQYAKPLTYRGRIEHRAALLEVFKAELEANRTLKKAQILEYVVELGIEHYWARNDLRSRLEAMRAEHHDTRLESLVRILTEGLDALEKEALERQGESKR